MVESPKYHRLKEFMEAAKANKGLDAWNDEHKKTIDGFKQAVERLKAYRDGHGFKGEAAKAMDNWVNQSIDRIEGYRSRYEEKYQTYQDGRATMAKALDEAGSISDTLVDPLTAAMGYVPVVALPSSAPGDGFSAGPVKFTTGSAYVAGVEAQNNEAREAACGRILDALNNDLGDKSDQMNKPSDQGKAGDPTKDKNKKKGGGGGDGDNPGGGGGGRNPGGGGGGRNPGGGGYGGGGYTPENGFGREAGRNGEGYPDGFDKPWWSEADAAAARNRVIASGAVPTKELPYGELGSRTNPITDPQDLMDTDLLHTRVNGTTYRNGVVGGHTPAPAADALHPLWRLNNNAAADAMTAGRLGGAGVLGAGALGMRGAARMGSGFGGLGGASGSANGLGMGGLRGISGTTGSAASFGGTNLRVGTYSGSGFGSYTPPASVAGANGAAGAGAPGVTGTTGAGGGAAGAAGAAGRGGAGAGGGFMGGGAGAGAGMGKDDKKGRKRKYVAFSVDEDDDDLPAGYVNPLSQTYGTDRTIAPAKREDDGWDLRQW